MKECIICRKETTDFSSEHVIPDSLGGYYTIHSVCPKCNSELGMKVDSKLVNHKFTDFQRYLLGIKGKSGKIPNPFSGTHSLSKNPTQKVQIRIDLNGKTIPYMIPSVTHNESNGAVESIDILVDATDKDRLETIVKKTAKRLGVSYENISINETLSWSQTFPEIHIQLSIALQDFKIGLLKIAYEFAVDFIPEYYNDPLAIEISNILYTASYERAAGFVRIGNGFQHEIMEPFEHLLDFDSQKHYLIQPFKGGLLFLSFFQQFGC